MTISVVGLRNGHIHKISPKMVNPRNIAEEEEEELPPWLFSFRCFNHVDVTVQVREMKNKVIMITPINEFQVFCLFCLIPCKVSNALMMET